MQSKDPKSSYYSGIRYDSISLLDHARYEKILEIGGGTFETLQFLDPCRQLDLWGVDIIDKRSDLRINFMQGSIEEAKICALIPDNYFDLIIANDVLEHLADTENFFRVCSDKLKQNGNLLLSVPNIRNIKTFYYVLLNGSFPRFDHGLFDSTHLRWFTKKDLLVHSSKRFVCLDIRSKGKLVSKVFEKTFLAEFLAGHTIALLQKSPLVRN